VVFRRLREDRTRSWRLQRVARHFPQGSPRRKAAKCRRGDLGMTVTGIGIEGSKVRSQKRASRAGIQLTKPIGPLESTDVKKDGTIADLKTRLAPKPSLPGHQHAKRQHEEGLPSSSYREPVHHSALEMQEWTRASGNFAHRPLWESSWCLSGFLVFCWNRPWILSKQKSGA